METRSTRIDDINEKKESTLAVQKITLKRFISYAVGIDRDHIICIWSCRAALTLSRVSGIDYGVYVPPHFEQGSSEKEKKLAQWGEHVEESMW